MESQLAPVKKKRVRLGLFSLPFSIKRKSRRPPEPKGRKVVNMMTLKELKKMVVVADSKDRVPGFQYLRENVDVVVKEVLSQNAEVTVYANGYVVYSNRICIGYCIAKIQKEMREKRSRNNGSTYEC